MNTGAYNISIEQYATYTKTFIWTAGACCCAGTVGASPGPVDLTGYTANLQIRPFALSTAILFDASSDITLGGVLGTILLSIPASVTATFTWFTGVYDLILTDSSGVVTRLLQGSVNIQSGVTP
jgi:hypothetical protein